MLYHFRPVDLPEKDILVLLEGAEPTADLQQTLYLWLSDPLSLIFSHCLQGDAIRPPQKEHEQKRMLLTPVPLSLRNQASRPFRFP